MTADSQNAREAGQTGQTNQTHQTSEIEQSSQTSRTSPTSQTPQLSETGQTSRTSQTNARRDTSTSTRQVSLHVRCAVARTDFDLQADLDFEPGSVTAVLGPNGAGKSTLLWTLAGLLPPTSGTIRAGDAAYPDQFHIWDDPARGLHLEARERGVGLVLADPLLFGHLSLLDNVAFGPRSRGVPRQRARNRARLELERLGLGDLSNRRPQAVSTGQAQRAALARALATDPVLLLLDEPLSALDPQTRSATRADLHRRLREFNGIALVVTHDPVDALTLADRLVFLDGGRVVQVDTPAAAIARPRNAYVARIVGLNLLQGNARVDQRVSVVIGGDEDDDPNADMDTSTGTSSQKDTMATTNAAPRTQVITAEDPATVSHGQRLWLTIDPAAISLYDTPPEGSTRNIWPATVRDVTVVGQRARINLNGPVQLIAEVTTGAVADLGLVAGRQVYAGVKATEVVTYPA
ncbi:MAG: ATP-binding cassette domain-containing protein [Ornithinimicrobium sp.]